MGCNHMQYLFVIKQSVKVDKAVEVVIGTGTHSCFRKALFSHFDEHTTSVELGHLCCTYCHSVCSCVSDVCGEPIPKHELLEPDVCTDLKCSAGYVGGVQEELTTLLVSSLAGQPEQDLALNLLTQW